jgi:hypothetical protein
VLSPPLSNASSHPNVNPELATLSSWLDYQRATLLTKLEGLTEEQAGQRTVPSDTTLHGIVRHVTTIEQWWFVECVAGLKEPYAYYEGEEIDWDWDLSRSEGLAADIDRYVAICEYARHNGHADVVRELIDGVTGE